MTRIRIFDDDIDLKNIEANGSDDELYFGTKEEKPVIAEVVDERPLHMRRKDIDTNRWKAVGIDEEEVVHKKKPKINSNKISAKKKKRNDSDSDLSPVRHKDNKIIDPKLSSRGPERQSDRDLSPPRSERTNPQTKRKRHDSDSDLSPERQTKERDTSRQRSRSRSHYEKDLSPARQRSSKNGCDSQRHDSDSDLSPPRNLPKSGDTSNRDKRRDQTLGGKKAGLSEAKHLREEILATKQKELKLFDSISDEMLGKNAKTVFRDSKSGRIRDLEEEARLQYQKDLVKDKIDSEKKQKYEKWSKGLIQTQQQKEKLESDLHEMSKPLARYEGDLDLDQMLREKEREDDPMLEAIRKNKTQKQIKEGGITVRPEYKGPPPPMNRFNIKPGYRWDGVDRSNGFEKKYFERLSNKEANLEEAYRWATEDM